MTPQELSPAEKYEPWFGVVGVILASTLGGLATAESTNTWYPTLEKPALNPPDAVFGPVWTVLYIMIAVAYWQFCKATPPAERKTGRLAFWSQLTLNLLWSLVFFGLKTPLGGLVVIAGLLATIVWTISAFQRKSKVAAWLLVPYLTWVSFASYLNLSIWLLNS